MSLVPSMLLVILVLLVPLVLGVIVVNGDISAITSISCALIVKILFKYLYLGLKMS